MSFGFRAINDSGIVQIDSMTPALSLLEKGTYAATGTNWATVTFSQPITSSSPPLIFVHPTEPTTQDWSLRTYFDVTLLGTSGNWTGFTFRTYNNSGRPQGRWFVASSEVEATATYGMRLWDESGKLIFDSDRPSLVFTRAIWPWTYAGTLAPSGTPYWTAGVNNALVEAEYLLINSFAMNELGFNTTGGHLGIHVNYESNKVWMIDQAAGTFTLAGHKPLVYAKLTAT